MEVDTNYSHKYFTVYSGYRPVGELNPTEFSVELTQPLLDVKEIRLDYAQFPNVLAPLQGLTFSWSENGYGPETTFQFPDHFLSPLQLITYIQDQMNALSPSGHTYTLTLDGVTGIITWDSTGPFSIYAAGPTTSSYNLGLNQVADGRNLYPGIPQYYTPLGNSFTAPWPFFNREWGIAVHVRPWSSNDSCSNDFYLDSHQFVIPLSSNYGDTQQYYRADTFRQNIAFFKPGHSFKRLFFSLRRWVDTNNHITENIKLNGEILLRFSYSTYRDTQAITESLTLTA